MNKSILAITESFGFGGTINDISNNLENATKETAVFYSLSLSADAERTFSNRVNISLAELIFVSRDYNHVIPNKKIISLGQDEFLQVQRKLLDNLYPRPELKLIGVTGTNGKTSTVSLASQISELSNVKSATIGTLGVFLQGKYISQFGMTTPSYIDFRKIIYYLKDKASVIFFELSSHGLEQDRIYDTKINAAGWISFSQDHLDYHKTMEEYFNAKLKITRYLIEGNNFFVPSEEIELIKMILNAKGKLAKSKTLEDLGVFVVPKTLDTIFGRRNLELALNLCQSVGIDLQKVDFSKLHPPLGRFSIILNQNKSVIIDYAHTPDALEKVIVAAKQTYPGCKLITVFGCGGNRDKKKRPIMGEIASRLSEIVIITSDNPRDETPMEIVNQINSGIKDSANILIELDRASAIKLALSKQDKDIVVLIAGKGHEDYQEIKGMKYPFSDFEEVENFIRNNK
jgi:UDP-N-acetylmuramoyl-L-alanyl-D-glutamate--2,6-diaminopimelate ligase